MFKSEVKTPVNGKVESISNITGQVVVSEEPITIKIDAYIPGNIEKIYESFLDTYGYDHLKIDILYEKYFENCQNSLLNPKERMVYWSNLSDSSDKTICVEGDC